MRNILIKEFRLSASLLSYLFIVFGLMFFIPGYPILCGVFFVTLGIFQSFQNARETNDILFSALLPYAKRDAVLGKYFFVCIIELCALILMAVAVIIRMTLFSDATVYRDNPLMNANPFALGLAFVIFAVFNAVFVGGFFKTAYKFARPFVTYIIAAFLLVGLGEALHHFPGLEALNSFGTEQLALQLSLLAAGVISYAVITWLSCSRACRCFEKIDL